MTDFTHIHLTHLDAISLQGQDVLKFLQGQCTQDVQRLKIGQPLAGAFCTAKGRTVANVTLLLVETEPTQLLLIGERECTALLAAHLKKYAAFFRAMTFQYDPQAIRIVGLIGQLNQAQRTELQSANPGSIVCPWTETQSMLCMPSGQQLSDSIQCHTETELAHWQALDIQHKRLWLDAEQSGLWIPQNINLDELDAISFNKGCYTGQEVVARLHYKGQSKKRLFQLMAGTKTELKDRSIYHLGKAIGSVIQSTQWNGQSLALAVLKTDAVESPLYADENQQVVIELLH